jgi:hypothetical protein
VSTLVTRKQNPIAYTIGKERVGPSPSLYALQVIADHQRSRGAFTGGGRDLFGAAGPDVSG